MRREELSKYLYISIIALLVVLSFLIVRAYVLPLISGFILAYLSKPLYDRLLKGLPKSLAAVGCILFAIIVLFVPIASIIGGIVAQASNTIGSTTISEYTQKLESLSIVQNLNLDVQGLLDRGLQSLITLITSATTHIPSIAIALFITAFSMYYILIDWERITNKVTAYLPVTNKKRLSKEIALVSKNLVYGSLFIALLEFILAVIGFWIAGVKYFLLLPALIAIFAFIPGLGPTAVWIPTAIILAAQGNWFATIVVTITGLILTGYIDSILRAKVNGKASNTHPLTVLVGIFGGIALFGIFGFIIGPLILSYTLKILQEVAVEMQ